MIKSFGVTKTSETEGITDCHIEEFHNLGYTIIEDLIPVGELDRFRKELMRIYELQEKEFGLDNLKKINEENLARALLCHSDLYLRLARNAKALEYVKKLLGTYFVLHLQNGIINMPGQEHHQNSWHRDFPYQNWVSSEPIGCNVFYCLDDFSEENGATYLLPHSHKIAYMPSEEYLEKHAVQMNAKAGSAILFDSMMFHKAGFNRSADKVRRGINHLYAKAIVRQQINLPAMLGGKYADDPFLNMLLGYGSNPPASVLEWRKNKLSK